MTELSFLFAGSKLIASVYFYSASSYFWFLMNSFPYSFSCSHFLALLRASLHFWLSGSSLIPSTKNFFALALSPPYNSMIPFKYQKSGFELLARGIVFIKVRAEMVSPVFAKASTLKSLRWSLFWIFSTRYFIHERASGKSSDSRACLYL